MAAKCITVAELRSFKDKDGLAYKLNVFNDAELESVINQNVEWIEKLCGNKFRRLNEVWKLDGSGTDILRFPPSISYPLITVTEVKKLTDTDDIRADEEILTEDDDFVNCGHYLRKKVSYDTSRLLTGSGSYFVRGTKNWQVSGIWGQDCPEQIKRILKLLSVETLIPGVSKLKSGPAMSESIGDYSVSYGSVGSLSVSNTVLTGFGDIDRILGIYVNFSSLFSRDDTAAYLISSTPV